ncbi:partial protein O-GlcNAc transferase, partial [Rhodocyclaceae bacterium]
AALRLIRDATKVRSDVALYHSSLGTVFQSLGRLEEALEAYRRALTLEPDYPEALSNLGLALQEAGQQEDAVAAYRQALERRPDFAEAHYNLGNALNALGRTDEAIASYRQALTLRPAYAEAGNNLGLVLQVRGMTDEAIAVLREALRARPDFAAAWTNLGNALQAAGDLGGAVDAHRVSLRLQPGSPDAHYNLAAALKRQGQMDEAAAEYRRVLATAPEHVATHYNLGNLLREQGRLEEACTAYRAAIDLDPGHADAHMNLGLTLQRRGLPDEALTSYGRALEVRPDFPEACSNRGNAFMDQGRLDEATESYRQALRLRPDFPQAFSNLLLALQYAPRLSQEKVFAEHRRYAERFEDPLRPGWRGHANPRDPERRLRLGYVSGDFRDHAVAHFIEPVLAHHDKSGFEVFCYYGHFHRDATTDRIAATADHWVPCAELGDDELAERIRSDGIDLLVDLAGHTALNRLPVFARKPAPVQATWLGYPATTGLAAMDYRITEENLDPAGMTEAFHTETLLRLPSSAAFRPAEDSPPVNDLPALGTGGLVLASLNNLVKINGEVIRVWARILAALPGAQLMLGNATDAGTARHLVGAFAAAGVAADRLILHPKLSMADYLALHHRIDLALDPFPYNGGTTSCHSLWMGVPVVTLAGRCTASRYGVALMEGLGLGEFVAPTEDAYVARVLQLAGNLPRLNAIRQSLRQRIAANLDRDPQRLTRHLEAAYRDIWKRWCVQG